MSERLGGGSASIAQTLRQYVNCTVSTQRATVRWIRSRHAVQAPRVMGKGIALMFKDRFHDNFRQYAVACKAGQVETGRMFITETVELDGCYAPR